MAIRRADSRFRRWSFLLTVIFLVHQAALGQGSYTAQVRGTVTDPAHAVVNNAKVTVTNESTSIATTATTNTSGEYVVNGLRPASYTIKVEAPGFRDVVRTGLVLAVSQQATVDFALNLASTKETVTVTETAPLLDTGSSALGTDVTNEFVSRMPLQGRDATQLVYLSAGVTKLNNADAYPDGTDFSSNGQRYGSAEIRLDGNLATGPEQGEGATNNLSYMPSTEVIQEFKVQNNSFAAEYGSNGGTVVNVLMKSGTNKFHGSGWWFGQRPWLNANNFFAARNGIPRTGPTHDQYGFSLGGPIFKGKTFFLVDLERQRNISKNLISARVPTALERQGDFTQTLTQDTDGNTVPVQLFNPFNVDSDPSSPTYGDRQPFPVDPTTGSTEVIPQSLMSPVWNLLNAKNAFPLPTGPIDNSGNNFNQAITETSPSTQFDIKLDHQLTNNVHLMGRYSQNSSHDTTPGLFQDGSTTQMTTRNVGLEHAWTLRPNLLLTSRFGLDRYFQNEQPEAIDPAQFGFQSILTEANNIVRMTEVNVDNYASLNGGPNGGQCCITTVNGHTQYVYSSSLNWVKGNHVLKFGGEQRLFFNNFFQPDDATGLFHFSGSTTAANALFDPLSQDGDAMAALELGWPSDGHINIKPAVLEKSKETAFYAQDDWKVTSRLTLSLGLRYEWSVPYTERFNRIQFSNFTGNSGVTVDLTPPSSGIVDNNGDPVDLSSLGLGPRQLLGTTVFPSLEQSACSHRPQQFWTAVGLCLPGREGHGSPRRRGALLRAFVRYQLPVSGNGVPGLGGLPHLAGRWRNPCPGLGTQQRVSHPASQHASAVARNQVRRVGRVGAGERQRSGDQLRIATRRFINGTLGCNTCCPPGLSSPPTIQRIAARTCPGEERRETAIRCRPRRGTCAIRRASLLWCRIRFSRCLPVRTRFSTSLIPSTTTRRFRWAICCGVFPNSMGTLRGCPCWRRVPGTTGCWCGSRNAPATG